MAQTGFKPADKAVEKVLKIAQIGDSGVGKTCILNRFTENTFSATFVPTIGCARTPAGCRGKYFLAMQILTPFLHSVDYKKKIVEVGGGRKVKVQIWDTAGQARSCHPDLTPSTLLAIHRNSEHSTHIPLIRMVHSLASC
jgi:GTPase SAR1 family protein